MGVSLGECVLGLIHTLKPVGFFSQHLHVAEMNYSTSEKELLAVVRAIEYFKQFLFGVKFTVITDHRPLKWLFTAKKLSSRLARWAVVLAEYTFDIVYREGKKNICADAMSRCSETQEDIDKVNATGLIPNNIKFPEIKDEVMTEDFSVLQLPKTTVNPFDLS